LWMCRSPEPLYLVLKRQDLAWSSSGKNFLFYSALCASICKY
jgi:hypothetical protein